MYTTLRKERLYKTEAEALYNAVDEQWLDLMDKLSDKKIFFRTYGREPIASDIWLVVDEVKDLMKDFSPVVIKVNFEE